MKLLGRKNDDGMLSCRQVGKVLQSFLDRELDDLTIDQVETHLDMCRRCGMEAVMYRQIKESLARGHGDVSEITRHRLRRFGERLAAGDDDSDDE